jgi:hypothetical protein
LYNIFVEIDKCIKSLYNEPTEGNHERSE